MSKEKAEKNIQEALNYLRLDFRNLGAIMHQYHPLEVLKMAAWEERRISRTRSREPFAAVAGRLLPVLLQSIVQSTSFDVSGGISTNRSIKEKDWQRIKALNDDVVKRLLRSIECYTVLSVRSGVISEEAAPAYRQSLFEEAFPPAEDKERVERLSYLTYAAMKSSGSVIEETYGTKPDVLVDQLYRIIRRGLEGIDRLSEEASIYKSEVETLSAQKRAADPTRIISEEDLVREIIKENGWESRVSRLAGERDDFDLFRPEFAADLPEKAYEALSVYPGTLDIHAMMLKGLWPATIYPFLHFGNMYFSFVSQHIQSYALRILQETAGLSLQYTEATLEALRLLFREEDDDAPYVYLFDGNKVDVSVLSSLVEVNAFTSPELFQSRFERRAEEERRRPSLGHKGLIVEPDDFEELREESTGIFRSSSYFIMRAASDPERRKAFCRTLFGQLEMPEPSEYDAIIDPVEIEKDERIDDDLLDDRITDEYEYDSEDEDERERLIEEKEKQLEESIPEDYPSFERSAEIGKLQEKYALTSDIIKRDEEMAAEADEYEKELDDDEFEYDDDASDPPDAIDDDIDPETESIYDEAEKEDVYADDSYDDPDQLTFFDELFGDEDEMAVDKLEDEELAEEDEEAFEEAEREAESFAESEKERLPNGVGEEPERLDDDSPVGEAIDADDEPLDGMSSYIEQRSQEEESSEPMISDEAAIPSMEEAQTASPFGIDADADSMQELHDVLEEPSAPADAEPAASDGMEEPDDGLYGYDGSAMETMEAEKASDHEEPEMEEAAASALTEEEEASEKADPAIADGLEEVLEPAADEAEVSAAAFEAAEPEPAAPSDENALPEEIADPESAAEAPSDEPEESVGSEMLPDEAIAPEEADDAAEPSSDMPMAGGGEETTETLIGKGLVKQVEADGEGSAFVMTEANEEASEPADEVPQSPEFPGILGEIASHLESGSAFVSFLSSSDGEMLDYLGKVIRSSWEREQADGKDKMFSIYDCSISVLIAANKVNDELRKEELLNNAGAVMYSRHKDRWHALILSIDEDFHILDAYERTISPDSFSASNWKICRIIGEQLIARGR